MMAEYRVLDTGSLTSVLILAVTILMVYMFKWRKKLNLPPGPVPYPLIGNLPLMRSGSSIEIYRRLRSEYGDIFKVQMGLKTFIIFNGYDLLMEAFVKRGDTFSHRPYISTLRQNKGLVTNSGESWKRTRTFTLSALREFGFGRRSLQSRVTEEVDIFIDLISLQNGKPFDVSDIVSPSVSNIICSIVLGDRFDHNDEGFKALINLLNDHFVASAFTSTDSIFPFLRKISGNLFNFGNFEQNRRLLFQFCRSQIKVHRETYDDGINRDLIDAFLKEEKRHPEDLNFSGENLIITILNLFFAGTETTVTVIRWAILYMIYYPQTQDKMREEIERVIGSSRTPTMEDKPELPYCEAFVIEVLRFANITPHSLPHGVSEDIKFKGFDIPEDAVLILNIDSVLSDPDYFPNPDKFDPSRFIGEDGKVMGYEKVIAFSIGRRICLGEALARMELFLFLTSLVQRFRIKPVNPDKLPTLDGTIGVTRYPNPYELIAEIL